MKWESEHAQAAREGFVGANGNAKRENTSVDFTENIEDAGMSNKI